MNYRLKRSSRKSIGIEITPDGGILVRAPHQASPEEIDRVLAAHADWIREHQRLQKETMKAAVSAGLLTDQEIDDLFDQALEYIPGRARYYARKLGVHYGRITIRNQKTRWGSCSSKGNLNFNCLLMLTPPEVIDSVVVHELCHLKHMNHSQAFYDEVYRIFPDYDRCHRWLKEHGGSIMARMTGG